MIKINNLKLLFYRSFFFTFIFMKNKAIILILVLITSCSKAQVSEKQKLIIISKQFYLTQKMFTGLILQVVAFGV